VRARIDRRRDFRVNLRGLAKRARRCIEAFDRDPVWLARQLVIYLRGSFEVREIGFLQIAARFRVIPGALAAHQAMRLCHRQAKIDHQILGRKRVDLIFQLLQPREKFRALFARRTRALMRQVRSDVTVREHDLTRRKRGFNGGLRFEAVARIEQRGKMGIYRGQRAEFAVQKLGHELAEKTAIVGKADLRQRHSAAAEFASERLDLRAFAGAVNPFKNDELPADRHRIDAQFSSRERLVTSTYLINDFRGSEH